MSKHKAYYATDLDMAFQMGASRFPELTNIIVDKGFAIDENATVSAGYDEKELAYILYTSGTTGKPKGVSVTVANVCHYVRAFRNEFHPSLGDIMLQHSVCSFDIFVEEVFTTLLSGAALAIPSDEERADVKKLIKFIRRNNVTMLSGFPYLLQEINDLPEILKSLRLLISGGDVPNGEVGELCIFGDGVSNGYIGNRAEENKAFEDTANGRMYKSGDLGYYLFLIWEKICSRCFT